MTLLATCGGTARLAMSGAEQMIGADAGHGAERRNIYIVDDESSVRRSLSFLLKVADFEPRPFLNGSDFLEEASRLSAGCVLLDIRMPGQDGLEVLAAMRQRQLDLPVIVMTGHGDIPIAVRAMQLGAVSFIEKPFEEDQLLEAVAAAFDAIERRLEFTSARREATERLSRLSQRETELLHILVDGKSNKEAAYLMDLSVRTVEMHRAAIFDKMGVRTLAQAIRIVFTAGQLPGEEVVFARPLPPSSFGSEG